MDRAVAHLLAGGTGSEAMDILRQVYTSKLALRSKSSLVRKWVTLQLQHPAYSEALGRFAREFPECTTFIDANPWRQLQMQRRHLTHPLWSAEAERAMQAIPIMDHGATQCELNSQERAECAHATRTALLAQNASILSVPDGDALLDMCAKILLYATGRPM